MRPPQDSELLICFLLEGSDSGRKAEAIDEGRLGYRHGKTESKRVEKQEMTV